MGKEIIFIVLDKYADWEGAYAAHAICAYTGGAYSVRTASLTRESVASAGGFATRPNYIIPEIPTDYAGLVLIGGEGWAEYEREAQCIAPLVRKCRESGRLLAAIGSGVSFLAKCGALNDVCHTAQNVGMLENAAGEEYTGQDMFLDALAVRSGQVVTAVSEAAMDFARAVLSALCDADRRSIDAWFNVRTVTSDTEESEEVAV